MPVGHQIFLVASVVISLLSFGFAGWLYAWVKKQPQTNARISEVGGLIPRSANTFLAKEYVALAKFAGVAAVLIFLFLPTGLEE